MSNFFSNVNHIDEVLTQDAIVLAKIETDLASIAVSLKVIANFFFKITPPEAVDLNILFGSDSNQKGSSTMANKKGTGSPQTLACLVPKGAKKSAVQPGITLTTVPSSITLRPLDAGGNPIVLTPADTVTGTLTDDNAAFVVAPGDDTLHYTITIPANTPQGTVVNFAATAKGTIQGAPADLSASVPVTFNIPPAPVAVDMDIVFA